MRVMVESNFRNKEINYFEKKFNYKIEFDYTLFIVPEYKINLLKQE